MKLSTNCKSLNILICYGQCNNSDSNHTYQGHGSIKVNIFKIPEKKSYIAQLANWLATLAFACLLSMVKVLDQNNGQF